MTYIHELPGWPGMHWNEARLLSLLGEVRFRQGRLLGRMEAMGFPLRSEANLATLTIDVVKSSAIEGEHLDASQVRSSIARRLGIDIGGFVAVDREVEGIVEMMLDATQNHAAPLTAERLFSWHAALFPNRRSGMRPIVTGAWRDAASGPMQVVSGPVGREQVHFEAPEADRLDGEMTRFLDWFAAPGDLDPLLVAGIAHLHFVTVHPFDDGNGRIARAIADLALARAEGTARRFYSMSARIEKERKDYYLKLERTQRGDLDITLWLEWFLGCLDRALGTAEETLSAILHKAEIWEMANRHPLNERQRLVINRILDGFEGNLTTSKYAKLAKCSDDTALRDILSFCEAGLLTRSSAGGRSTSYSLIGGEN
jgi:Fic family protein